jgi:hypothetical protein
MESLSQEFYKNITDVKFMFHTPKCDIRSEIMNSTLRFSVKQDLIKNVDLWSETKDILDSIPDTTLAVKLALETKHPDDYIKHRFGYTIDDSRFVEFFAIIKLLTAQQLCLFCYSMDNQENIQQFYNYVDNLKYEDLIQIINRCAESVLNFVCSVRTSLIHAVEQRHSTVLTGRNLYRYVIYQLNRDKTINNRIPLNQDAILHIEKFYPELALAAVQQWNLSDTADLFEEIIKSKRIGIAHRLFNSMDKDKQDKINRKCFAIYTDFDLNTLTEYELRDNIFACKHNQLLLERLSTVEKERLVKLISEWRYYSSDDGNLRETILVNFFGVYEIRKFCETNLQFAKSILSFLTEPSILTQLSQFEWFWKALANFSAELIVRIADVVGNHKLLDNLKFFDYYTVAFLFNHYFVENKEFAFQLINASEDKTGTFLSLPGKINEILEHYSLATIVEWCETEYDRRNLLERLPLATAFLMAKELNLTKESPEFSNMHLSRKKALLKRLFN